MLGVWQPTALCWGLEKLGILHLRITRNIIRVNAYLVFESTLLTE